MDCIIVSKRNGFEATVSGESFMYESMRKTGNNSDENE